MALQMQFEQKTINEFVLLQKHGQINLEPGFQRLSVWRPSDRRKLIDSVVRGLPLPSVFLHCSQGRGGKPMYDVIDGKQRLETIFMFMGVRPFEGDVFSARLMLNGDGRSEEWSWEEIRRSQREVQHAFLTYPIQVVEVKGDLSDVVDLFICINSTGKPLTSQERRHARYYTEPLLMEADGLAKRFAKDLAKQQILTTAQLTRMKGVELMLELLLSVHSRRLINKKSALDHAMKPGVVDTHTLAAAVRETSSTLRTVLSMFDLRHTRFRNSAEFYSLFMLIWSMQTERYILDDPVRNKAAQRMLELFSAGVDNLREQLRRAKPATRNQGLYGDYLVTVQGDTDSSATRQRRETILRGLLCPLLETRDAKRAFSLEQRRVLWNTEASRKCSRCGKELAWGDFDADHVVAWSRGGRTELGNAQLLCRRCNRSKGARP